MLAVSNTWSKWPLSRLISFSVIGLVFTIPISSSGKSIFLALAVALILFSRDSWDELRALLRKNWCKAALSLLAIAVLACLWSNATIKEQWMVLEKYSKLLYLPILVVGFKDKRTRYFAIHAFLAAMFLSCTLSVLKYLGIIQALFSSADLINYDAVFRNHIMTGLMMSFAAYIAGLFFLRGSGKICVVYALLFLLFSYQILFVNAGRTGYILYFILMIILMAQVFTKKQAAIAITAVCFLSFIAYQFSPPMQAGIQRVVSEWTHYKEEKNTSVGFRIQFHKYAKELFQEHPLYGNGTGSFTYSFRVFNPVPSWEGRLLEPHSQYWLIAAEFGLLGLLAFLIFIASLVKSSTKLPTLKPIALALISIFLIGNVSDSLLLYSGTGYFFLVLMALCLGEEDYSPVMR